jgi:hypothetical protein
MNYVRRKRRDELLQLVSETAIDKLGGVSQLPLSPMSSRRVIR